MLLTATFLLVNSSYVWPPLPDPFGWSWAVLGSAGLPGTRYLSGVVPISQIPVLPVGLAAAINLSVKTARPQGALPVIGQYALATAGFLWLYLE